MRSSKRRLLLGSAVASVFVNCILLNTASLCAQEERGIAAIRSEVKHIGAAEVRAVTKDSGFFPDRQPQVYWHDPDWQVDLAQGSAPNGFSLKIASRDKREKVVKLPWDYSQIDSITVTENEKAIVVADLNGMTQAFCIADLQEGKILDNIGVYDPSISPDRRFVLFNNWYPPHAGGENLYRIYDVFKSPRENTCGYRTNDPTHSDLSGAMRGFQVYPQSPGQVRCDGPEDEDDDNQSASDYIWSADSSKVVFADVKSGVISLILVATSNGNEGNSDRKSERRDLPQTSIHSFVGADDVCAGASTCDYNNVKSVAWNGDAINVALIKANPGGAKIEKDLTIPLSSFVPISSRDAATKSSGHNDNDHQ